MIKNITGTRNYVTSSTRTILRLGAVRFAQQAWTQLSEKHNIEILETTATSRDEFIKEVKEGKYNNVECITRTFESVKQTGLFDNELIELLKKHTKVKLISHNGAGYDQINVIKCGELDIKVSNVPKLVDDATADTAIYLLLGSLRNFQMSSENLKKGLWPKFKCANTPIGNDPNGKNVGILGMGGIGRDIRDRLKPFKFANIYYYNRKRLSEELEEGAIYMESIEKLFGKCDIICISIPLNKNTKHLINDETINMMKDGVILINTARGGVIDEKALKKALQNGKIKGFGSDVFDNEPNVDMELINMPQVTSLPHMGTHSFETMKAMEEFVVENVDQYLINGEVIAIVPELA